MNKKKIPNRFRSNFEKKFMEFSEGLGITPEYESVKMDYILECTYTPDFIFRDKDGRIALVVETKGRLTSHDRRKMLAVLQGTMPAEWYPRVIFMNPNVKLYKGSNTTYGEWATKNEIKWGTMQDLPKWLKESGLRPRKKG